MIRKADIWIEADSFASIMYHAFVEQVAPQLTCEEANYTVALYRALGRHGDADSIADAHSYGDTEPDDEHYRGDALCQYESAEPGTLLCVLPMGHGGEHDTPRYNNREGA